mgnify:CR=1 FL=1
MKEIHVHRDWQHTLKEIFYKNYRKENSCKSKIKENCNDKMKWGAETGSWKQIGVGAIKSKWQVKVIKEKE